MDFLLDPDQMKSIQEWLDGQSAEPPKDELEAYFRLGEAIRRKMLSDTISRGAKAKRLEEKLERYRQKEENAALEGDFECLGIDTVDLSKAVLWAARSQYLKVENKTRFRLLVFAVYCSWLGSPSRQRVTVEHPIAQSAYGPCLPSMLNERDVTYQSVTDGAEYRRIAEIEPGLAAVIRNAVAKYCKCSLQDLKDYFMGKGTPFAAAAEQCTKKGLSKIEIPDRDIYLWKRSHA